MRRYFLVAALFASLATYAQEVCNNGIDDDGDGFIDCFDKDCADVLGCEGTYVSDDPDCEVPPDVFPNFDLELDYATANRTTSGNGFFNIGDVDNDGTPELVTVNYYNSSVSIISGLTGVVEITRNLGTVRPYLEVIIADIDRDGCAEIFMPVINGSKWEIRAFDCSLNPLWTRETKSRTGNIGIADFDEDGFSEIYAKDEIIDAHSGALMASSTFSSNSNSASYTDKHLVSGGVAVDILADAECGTCDGLELVIGGKIYAVNVDRGTLNAQVKLERSIDHKPVYVSPWRQNRGGTSIADYNLDGFLDVIANGRTSTDNDTQVFFWDVKNNTVQIYKDNVDNWDKGTGRLNIADIDGDGQMNVTYVSGPYLYALDENWNLFWKKPIVEGSSGTTGTTVFDFNGDGKWETVYRDEANLYIIDGTTGDFFSSIPCKSLTYMEYPIVADVDNDGETEICVACMTNDGGDIWKNMRDSQIRVFKSKDDEWVAARKVWNQHAYFNANINDDLSVPIEVQKHHLIWSDGTCKSGPVRPLNNFLNQAPFLTNEGCPDYGSADLAYAGNVSVTMPSCPDSDIIISFDVSNVGDKEIDNDVPITFYAGDPFTAGAVRLNAVPYRLVIPESNTARVINAVIPGPGTAFDLYISVNDNGSDTPPIEFAIGGVPECNFDNNVGMVPIIPVPFEVFAENVKDNEKCATSSFDNGEARSWVMVGGAEETAGYTFNWWAGAASGPPDYQGANYIGLAAGTYFVSATHDLKMCSSDTVTVVINETGAIAPSIDITIDSDFSDCQNPDGQLTAVVNGGDDPADYDFVWIDGVNIGIADTVSISHIASGLEAKTYTVVVTDKLTGCLSILPETVPQSASFPVVDAVVDNNLTICDVVSPDGSATADVGGAQAGFTFEWYDGPNVKPTSDFTGANYTGLAAGQYTVRATNDGTGCTSDPLTIDIVDNTNDPTINITTDSEQTSCNVPNGAVSADVGGSTAGFTFTWFQGQTTDPTFEVAGSPSPSITGLTAGIYTVEAVNASSGCSATEEVTIIDDFPTITVTPSAIDQTNCTSPNGEITATAAGGQAPHTYLWYDGIVGTPDLNNPDYGSQTVLNLPAGDYTIVVLDATNCASATSNVTINDATVAPVITTSLTDQTSCDGLNPNGGISANVGGNTVDYTFNIYSGQNTNPVNEVTGSPNPVVTGLAAGIYTVLATEIATGCINSEEVTVVDNLPSITGTPSATPQTDCASPNGEVTAIAAGGVGPYSFFWFDGIVGVPDINNPDYTGATVSNLSAGSFTLVVQDGTGCTSAPVNSAVVDNTVSPTITTVLAEQTSCDALTPTGEISANVGGNTADFLFNIYSGQNTNPANEVPGSPSPIISGLAAGIYTVLATDNATGCFASVEVTVVDNLPTITPTASAIDQTDCGSPDGELTATVTGGAAPHTYLWYDGIVGAPDLNNPDYTTQTVSNLTANDYTLVVVDATGCASATVNITVNDISVAPTISSSLTDQTSCDGLNPNGGISADVGGNTIDYVFNIYSGQNTNPVNEVAGSPSPAVTGLAAGIYTILATDNATGCFSSVEVTVVDNLPTIVGSPTATDQTDCASPDGELTATVAGGAAPHTYLWYDGVVGVPDVNNPDYSGQTISNLSAGTFTLLVVDDNSCTSSPVNVTINDVSVAPSVTVVLTEQTSCDALNPNGGISANVGGNTIDYLFNVYAGQNTNPANEVPGSPSPSVTGLASGIYTLLTTDNATGCNTSVEVTIVDNFPTITGTPAATDQSDCGSPNGELSGTVIGGVAPHTYLWYDGSVGSPDVNNPDYTGQIISNLSAGDFTLLVVDANNCTSTPATISIGDASVAPVISTSTSAQTSCDTGSPNGGINANVGGNTIDYEFNIYAGQNTDPTNEVVGSPSASVSGLQSGIYTVLATDNISGCTGTVEVTIVDDFPTITASPTSTDQVDCAAPDGEVTATTVGGAVPHSYLWYDGIVGTPDLNNSDYTGQTISNLSAGVYTVVAIDANSCESAPANVTVNDASVAPVMTTNLTPQSSCDPSTPNGMISANVGGNTIDYVFNVFSGQNTNPANEVAGSPSATVGVLVSGIYTVLATDINTGCTATVEVNIVESLPNIVGTPSATDQTDCGAPDGEVTATATGGAAPHSYLWFDGNIAIPNSGSPDYTGQTISNLSAGDYTLVVVDANSCESSPALITLTDATVNPVITAVTTDQTACDPGLPNGTVSSNVGGNTADYTFRVYKGQNTLAANEMPGSPAAIVGNLPAGIFTVHAIHNLTGCETTTEVTVVNNVVLPSLTTSSTDITSCAPLDGTITATPSVGNPADYTFSWYDGGSTKVSADYLETGNTLSGIGEGTYTVTAFNNVLGCNVDMPVSTVVASDPNTVITIAELPAERIVPSDCASNSGQLGVSASSPTNVGGFTFSWFQGNPSQGMAFISNGTDIDAPATQNRLTSLISGQYSVIALDNDTGCQDTLSVFLPFQDQHDITLTATPVDQTHCTVANGSVDIDANIPVATQILVPGINPSFYTFDVYENGAFLFTVPGSVTNPTTIPGLAEGTYEIVAVENNAALPNNCSSPAVTVVIGLTVPPVTIVGAITENKSCVGFSSGEIVLTVDGTPTPAAGYTYSWHIGDKTSDPMLPIAQTPPPGHTAIDLNAGFYTVEVTRTATGCTEIASFLILNETHIISLNSTDIALTDQTNCAPVNGSATVTDIVVDGAAIGSTVNYTFDWYEADGVTLVPGAGNNATIAVGLSAGTYFVEATSTAGTTNSCSTGLTQFDIEENLVDPIVSASATNVNANCVGSTPNGFVTIEIDGGASALSDYVIEWFEGNTTATPLGTTFGVVAGADNETAMDLPLGQVTVRVTDNAGSNLACFSTQTFSIGQDLPTVTIAQADLVTVDNTSCSAPFTGSATVSQVQEDGVPFAVGGYTFEWYESDGTTLIVGGGNANTVAVGLAAGDYFVLARSNTSSCATSTVSFTIDENTTDLLVVASAKNANINCVGGAPTGLATIDVDGGANLADYTIDWFEGNTAVVPLGTTYGVQIGANGETASQLIAGQVTVRVVKNTSPNLNCETLATFTILNDQPLLTIASASLVATANDACAAPFNGSATVSQILEDGVGFAVGGYTFEWLESDGTTAIVGAGNAATIGVGLAPGTYTVRATNTASTCITSAVQFTIDDDSTPPVVTADVLNANTNCAGATPTGEVTVAINGGANLADYTIEWFEGSGTAVVLGTTFGVVNGADNETASDLPAGFVTVRVTDNVGADLNCQTVATFNVLNDQAVMSIATADLALTPNDACAAPFNGSATVAQVREDGVAFPVGGYTFEWFEADAVTLVVGAGNGPTPAVGLMPNDYNVRATSTTSNCVTTMVRFTIDDDSTPPVVTADVLNANTNCAGATPTGEVTIAINGGANLADYTIEWFEGSGTAVVLGTTFGVVNGADNETASDLPAGFVTVRVTDNVGADLNCQTVATFNVLNDQAVMSIATADLALTPNDACAAPFNGSATVAQVREDGVAFPVGGYTFEWFEADAVTLVVGAGNGPTPAVGLMPNDYNVRATSTTSNCVTTMVGFTIDDDSTPPVVTADVLNANTNCAGATPTGEVTIAINGGANLADYTIEWFEGSGTAVVLGTTFGVVNGADNETASDLPAGFVTVRVTDNVGADLNCQTVATFNVLNDQAVMSIATADLALTPNDACAAPFNGSATVAQVREDGVAFPVGGYTFEWFEADAVTLVVGAGNGPTPAVGLMPNDYNVRATSTTSNCVTTMVGFTIDDDSTPPVVTTDVLNANTNCAGATPTGEVTVAINGGANLADYTIEWFEGSGTVVVLGTTFGVVSGADNETASDLPAGFVTVRVTDNVGADLNCQTVATFNVLNDQAVMSIATADLALTPNDACAAPFNGSATVAQVREDGVAFPVGGYTFEWFEADAVTLVVGAGNGPTPAVGLMPNDYNVRATSTTSNCVTTMVGFTIDDDSTPPVVTADVLNANTNCAGATPTGEVTVAINGGANLADYTIEWFEGSGTVVVLGTTFGVVNGADNETASDLPAGFVTVRVTDNVGADLNCQTISTFEIVDDLPIISVIDSDIAIVNNNSCAAPFNGGVEVTSVREDGIAKPVGNYTFIWFESDAVTPVAGAGNTAISAVGLNSGIYYMSITNNVSQCSNFPLIEFEIGDDTILPQIDLIDFSNPITCDGVNPPGVLRVTANNSSSLVDYTFEWYTGNDPMTGILIEPNNSFVGGLAAGDYTVLVTDNTSGCQAQSTYTMVNEINNLTISLSSTPVTNCITPNGTVFAAVTNSVGDFDYEWYIGTVVTGTPDFTGATVSGLGVGTYTVVAIDQADPTCTTTEKSVEVIESLTIPVGSIVIDSPLTHCDPTVPNGQLTASVNGTFTGFTFEWFEGSDDTGPVIFDGPTANMLTNTTYTVRITNQVSGCSALVSESIGFEPDVTPLPDLILESDVTRCDLANGSLSVSIKGALNYDFNWYAAANAAGPVISTDILLVDIDAGTYSVTATDKFTGCTSEPVNMDVLDVTSIPEFEFSIIPSSCENPTGAIQLIPAPGTNILTAIWELNGVTVEAPQLLNASTGTYTVTVIGEGNCEATATVTVDADIFIYNGMSPNGDTFNEIFYVECLELFENNNVRIYNRAGQLIFNVDHYDNAETAFRGIGNRGLYLSGNELPDGTYFYIIDKGDGSARHRGYLELSR